MSFNFHIGSLIARINLAVAHNKNCIIEKKSPIGFKILTLLLKNHFIKNFIVSKSDFVIFLRYNPQLSVIKSIKVISSPSKRIFVSIYDLQSLINLNPCSFFILSTDKGLMLGKDCSNLNLGGELLFSINL